MLCKYKDIFGKPKEGVHAYRFLDIAIVDVMLTILLAYGIYRFVGTDFWITLIALIVLAMVLHWAFCVKTSVSVYLGLA
jgi:hypothetical protein